MEGVVLVVGEVGEARWAGEALEAVVAVVEEVGSVAVVAVAVEVVSPGAEAVVVAAVVSRGEAVVDGGASAGADTKSSRNELVMSTGASLLLSRVARGHCERMYVYPLGHSLCWRSLVIITKGRPYVFPSTVVYTSLRRYTGLEFKFEMLIKEQFDHESADEYRLCD